MASYIVELLKVTKYFQINSLGAKICSWASICLHHVKLKK